MKARVRAKSKGKRYPIPWLLLALGFPVFVVGFLIVVGIPTEPNPRQPEPSVNGVERSQPDGPNLEDRVLVAGENWTLKLPGGAELDLVWIGPGEFTMGSPTSERGRYKDETQHRVVLTKGYWLGKYEVTQGQWEAVMGSNPSRFKNAGRDAPVEQVSWDEAMRFSRKLTERERAAGRLPNGYVYSLPMEAQWEYACRAGTTTPFHYGSSLSSAQANFDGNHPYGGASKGRYLQTTVKVGSYAPNKWGLYDMHGNVWEWCYDWYGSYETGTVRDPAGLTTGSSRVIRGGGWFDFARLCRSANRHGSTPGLRGNFLGFRLALRPENNRYRRGASWRGVGGEAAPAKSHFSGQ